MLKTQYVRDGNNQIVANETHFENGDVVVRDREGRVIGRSSETFQNTRDRNGKLASRNSDDPGLLIPK
jgi:hypothetical protein